MEREPPIRPPGREASLKDALLEKGADWLQERAPVRQFDVYVVGFHCAKHEPSLQMEAHHYCHRVNRDFLQCLLFDGNTEAANLIGIEYIISERLFDTLPDGEKPYWHPHNYEVFSGELVAPGLPQAAEKELMRMLVNSYGKTWHTWNTGRHDRPAASGDALPLGEPRLMWSFNRDGEVDAALKRSRDETMQIDTALSREVRRDLVAEARPQHGVDALKGAFPEAAGTPPGVQDVASRSAER